MARIRLQWTHDALAEDVTDYQIFYSTNINGPFNNYYPVMANLTGRTSQSIVIDRPLQNTYYKVRAINARGQGAFLGTLLLQLYTNLPTVPVNLTWIPVDPTTPASEVITINIPEEGGPVPPTTPNTINLGAAYGKIQSSSALTGTGNQPTANLINGIIGDDNNRWSTETLSTGTTFAEINLRQPAVINYITVDTFQNRIYKYKIEGKLEGNSYTTIVDRLNNTSPGPLTDIFQSPVTYQYIKITVTGAVSYDGNWVSLRQCDIEGPSINNPITSDPITNAHPGGLNIPAQFDTAAAYVIANTSPYPTLKSTLISFANARNSRNPGAIADWVAPNSGGTSAEQTAFYAAKNLLQGDTEVMYANAAIYRLRVSEIGQHENPNANADKAIAFLNNWASVNQHMDGDSSGNSTTKSQTELTGCVNFSAIISSAEYLYNYPGWTSNARTTFINWVTNVLGIPINRKKLRSLYKTTSGTYEVPPQYSSPFYNNHNAWGILCSLSRNQFIGDTAAFAEDINLYQRLIDLLINPDGSMPSEIERGTSSVNYTLFAVGPLLAAAEVIRNVSGQDLFNWAAPRGGNLYKCLDLVFKNGIKTTTSPFIANQAAEEHSAEIFAAAGRIYGNDEWKNYNFTGQAHQVLKVPDLETGADWVLPTLLEPLHY